MRPASFNERDNTVEAVLSTGADVRRGSYTERLDMGGVDLSALTGAHVLDNHRQGSTGDILGVVKSARVENGQLVGTLQLSRDPSKAGIIGDIQSGIIRNLSVGYAVNKYRDETDTRGNLVRVVTSWTPREVSFVPVPADSGSSTRNIEMTHETDNPEIDTGETEPAPDAADRAAINQAIRTRGTAMGLSTTAINGLIDRNLSLGDASSEILAQLTAARTPIRTQRAIESLTHYDAPGQIVQRAAEALYHRANPTTELPEAARPFRGLTLREMTRELLMSRGINSRSMGPDELFTRAITTGDLPNLLQIFGYRRLLQAYQLAPAPCVSLALATTFTDFRPVKNLRFAMNGQLQEVPEGGELQNLGTLEQVASSYALSTYGGMVELTRQAYLNDDLGAFSTLQAKMGLRARELENGLIAKLITGNPVLEDGNALFSTAHGNLAATGAAPSVATLSTARLALRTQKDLDGVTPISSVPKYLLVGPQLETAGEQLLAQLYPRMTDEANPFSAKISLLVEPRITDQSWYVFADPGLMPCLQYAHLGSAPGPQLQQEQPFNTLGLHFRIFLDFACTAMDFRGAYKNPGGS